MYKILVVVVHKLDYGIRSEVLEFDRVEAAELAARNIENASRQYSEVDSVYKTQYEVTRLY